MRFVDIVLILLFGFICISSIRPTQIQPPKSSETPYKDLGRRQVVYVSVKRDGTFLVDQESRVVNSAQLRSFLLQKRQQLGSDLKVRIRSHQWAPIGYLTQAARLCDELGIRKSIEVEIGAK